MSNQPAMTQAALTTLANMTDAMRTVMETLYDVATHEGGWIILKNKYHSPAHALEKRGYVDKQDRAPYRPVYRISKTGYMLIDQIKNPSRLSPRREIDTP